jgi:hypothetical protein
MEPTAASRSARIKPYPIVRLQPQPTARGTLRDIAPAADLDRKITGYIARLTAKIEAVAEGLVLHRHGDFDEMSAALVALGDRSPPWTTRLPSFDPGTNRMPPDEAFWLSLEQNGRMVGCIAAKLVRTANLKRDIDSLRIWYDKGGKPEFDIKVLDYHLVDGFSGLWSLGGKLWLDPTMRRTGLSTWLTVMIRAQMLLEHRIDGHFCLLKDSIAAHGLDTRTYLYPRSAQPALMLRSRRYGDSLQMSVNFIRQSEIVEEIEEAIDT